MVAGSWFELYTKQHANYIPLQVELKYDRSARYINRYPERSFGLTYTISNDSLLIFSNGVVYQIMFVDDKLLKLKKKNRNNVMLLEKTIRMQH